MSLNQIEHTIIKHMAKTMFAVAWADYQEQVLHKGLQGQIMDQVPETPDYVLQEAYYQAGMLAHANPGKKGGYPSLFFLFRAALEADEVTVDEWQNNEKVQQEFGYGMIMAMMGQGVSWFDNHNHFPMVTPYFEWSVMDLDEKTYPVPEEKES